MREDPDLVQLLTQIDLAQGNSTYAVQGGLLSC
jgi:hypothetical protein